MLLVILISNHYSLVSAEIACKPNVRIHLYYPSDVIGEDVGEIKKQKKQN